MLGTKDSEIHASPEVVAALVDLCKLLEDKRFCVNNIEGGRHVVFLLLVSDKARAAVELSGVKQFADGGDGAVKASISTVTVALAVDADPSVHAVRGAANGSCGQEHYPQHLPDNEDSFNVKVLER